MLAGTLQSHADRGSRSQLSMFQSCPWVGSTHGLGWVGLGWVGLGRGSETFPKILKLLTAEVIPDNLVMINTDK